MTLTLDNGKVFEAEFICIPLRDESRVIIEMTDVRHLLEIAADFDGVKVIEKHDEQAGHAKHEVFEGFTNLAAVQRLKDGTVRLTLEKGVIANV